MLTKTAGRALDDAATTKATLAGITVYPLKSAGGIALREAELDELGLRHDRRWTVVDAQDRALTQRTHPQLARIRAALEDRWRRIRIGGTHFHVVKSCGRCAITTTDQETGARGQEPLRTLARYRRVGGKVLFGRYLIHRGTGHVRVGEGVEVLEVAQDSLTRGPASGAVRKGRRRHHRQ